MVVLGDDPNFVVAEIFKEGSQRFDKMSGVHRRVCVVRFSEVFGNGDRGPKNLVVAVKTEFAIENCRQVVDGFADLLGKVRG